MITAEIDHKFESSLLRLHSWTGCIGEMKKNESVKWPIKFQLLENYKTFKCTNAKLAQSTVQSIT